MLDNPYDIDYDRNTQELVGQTLTEIRISTDGVYIEFVAPEKVFPYYTEGDCCSRSWIQDIFQPWVLSERPIDSVVETRMACGSKYNKFYSLKLKTIKGVCEIVYRNNSNGYYGGDLVPTYEVEDKSQLGRIDLTDDDDWTVYSP